MRIDILMEKVQYSNDFEKQDSYFLENNSIGYPMNISSVRTFLFGFLPPKFKDIPYRVAIDNKSEIVIEVYFDYDLNLLRDYKINSIINKNV